MWLIISIIILLAAMFFALEVRAGSLFVLGLIIAGAIMGIASANNDPDHVDYSHKEQIVSVVQKAAEADLIVELQRDGYTETVKLSPNTTELVDSPEKTLTTPKDIYTDKWVVWWDREYNGEKIISFPLDEIKLVK